CSGVTSSVTTVTCIGLPFSWSCSMRVPDVSTCTLARTTLDVVSTGWVVGLAVATTSTRVPGRTYPATPMTSFTRTDTARIPAGMAGGRPEPASFDASLAASTGSFLTRETINPRPMTSCGCENVPSGADPFGNDTT